MKRRNILVLAVCVCLILVLVVLPFTAGCATKPPPTGGVLKIIWHKGPKLFGYPPKITGDDFDFATPAVETLFFPGDKYLPQPWLATDWKLAPDGLSLTISLRKGVKFHDGTDFNAEAAKWNLETNKAATPELGVVKSIDVIDEHTIRLNLERFAVMLLSTLMETAGMMISPTAVANNGVEWACTHPVGTGPFKFESLVRDTSLKYVRFDDYWDKGKPYLSGIEYVIIPDPITGRLAFEAGEGHIIFPTTPVATELVAKGYPITMSVTSLNFLTFDSTNPDSPFANKKVREAIEYAIDKASAMAATGGGLWLPEYQLCPPGFLSYIPDFEGRRFDPAKARQLLAEAGYAKGFKTKIILSTAFFPKPDLFVIFQSYLRAVGIDVEIELATHGLWTSYRDKGWKDAIMLGVVGTRGDWAISLTQYLTTASGKYPSMLRPPGFDDLVDQALRATDVKAMEVALQKAQWLVFEEAMVIPLMSSLGYSVYHATVHDTNLRRWSPSHWTPANAWLSE